MNHINQLERPFSTQNRKSSIFVRKNSTINLKRGIWLYFLLLIFEGAIRRYIPPLATPFLLIRDPLALWLLFQTWKRGLFPGDVYSALMISIGIIGLFTALTVGHGNFFVALFGLRIFLIQFPLIFVIGNTFDRDDVIKIGKVTLWIAIGMVFLLAVQFYSPQSAWINQTVGNSGESGRLTGANGFYRPPGTFSFTTGVTLFYSLVTPYIIYFWLQTKEVNKKVLLAATFALLASIPLSISRGLLFQVILSIAFTFIALLRKPLLLRRMMIAIIGLGIVLALLSQVELFQIAVSTFSTRIDNANGSEGGLEGTFSDRYLGGLLGALSGSSNIPFWGYGMGMGTNVGSQLLTGQRAFLIAEGEWGRVIGEMGPLLGLMIVFLRVALTFQIGLASYKRLKIGNLMPWMLLSYGVLIVSQVGWAQPTSLGFCVLIGGLMLASLNVPKSIPNTNKAKP